MKVTLNSRKSLALLSVLAITSVSGFAHAGLFGKKKTTPPASSTTPAAPVPAPPVPTTVQPPSLGPTSEVSLQSALRCQDSYTMDLSCNKVSGDHEDTNFSLCQKTLADNSIMFQINVVVSDGKTFLRDSANYDTIKNITDAQGNATYQYYFKGQQTTGINTPTHYTATYTGYSFVANQNYANDQTWTHKLYQEDHSVDSTYNTSTGNWSNEDFGAAIGVEANSPNVFMCYRPQ